MSLPQELIEYIYFLSGLEICISMKTHYVIKKLLYNYQKIFNNNNYVIYKIFNECSGKNIEYLYNNNFLDDILKDFIYEPVKAKDYDFFKSHFNKNTITMEPRYLIELIHCSILDKDLIKLQMLHKIFKNTNIHKFDFHTLFNQYYNKHKTSI
jgi:hypothetical protein